MSTYLDFLVFFLPLAGFSLVCFSGMHPQPHPFFFSAILITSFLFKQLSNNLTICPKKFAYFVVDSNSFTLFPTVLSSFLSSSSYFLSDSKFDLSNSTSLNFPVPWHPHVQTSFNICRQFSMAYSGDGEQWFRRKPNSCPNDGEQKSERSDAVFLNISKFLF